MKCLLSKIVYRPVYCRVEETPRYRFIFIIFVQVQKIGDNRNFKTYTK